MRLLRMLYLQIICLQYFFKDSLSLPQCTSYTDLESKRGANCSHRSLVSIPHPLPPDTEILLLNYNNLPFVSLSSFQSLPHLKDLDLSHNQIQILDPDSPLPLEKLDLSSNSLTRIPDFRNLRKLKKLVLDHNQIPDLPAGAFDVLVSLEALSIKGNAIRVIPDGIFEKLEELTHLVLSGNRIERFPGNSLENAEYLDSLDLSSNNLSSVPEDFASIFAPYIYLYNNPWHCDCDTVRNFADWIQAVDGNIYDSTGLPDSRSIVCSSPPGQKGTPIIEFSPERICHVVTTIGTTLQTARGTERSHISTSTVNLFKTSPPPEICAPYTDLESKRGANCSHRSLVSIPHPLPPDTEILLLNYNNLSSVPLTSFQSLPHLRDLDLSHNQIQHFDPVSPLPLEKLDLSSNSLTRIPDFRNLRNLKKLVLDHNQIPDLPVRAFDVLVSLESLSIKGNAIRIIPDGIFDPLGNLRHLILSGNRIERFPGNSLENAEYLDSLDLSSNNLSSVPEDFASIFAPYIYLYNNPWHCDCDTVRNFADWIQAVDGNIYDSTGLPDSRSVVCSSPPGQKGTPIIEFSPERICHVVTTIGTTLQTPRGTERSHISTSTVNLFKTSPPLEICAPYTDLESKRGANCSHRSLVSIPHPLPPDTEILLLNYNNLSSVPLTSFQSLPHLKDLDLSHNQIQHFDPVSPLPLEKLDLSSNSLTRIPDFKNLRKLKKLVLDHNQIPDLPAGAFDVLVSLEALSIKGNAIRVIPDGIFEKLEELTHLVLSGNRIERFPGNSLENAEYLDSLDLSSNNLSSVPEDFVSIFAPYIYLYNNPWHCDCDTVRNFADWIQAVDGNIYDSTGLPDSRSVVCSSPPGQKGTPIIEFSPERICHVVTTIGTTLQTPRGTERSHISTSTVNLFKTSPPPEICAPYTDLESKRGANCSHRSLVSIPHPLPPDTEILLLNYNNLSSVPLTSFQSLPHLRDLDLSHNQIQHFDPVSPLPLEKLDLSSNSLTRIPDFRNLRNLKKLVLDHNQIPDLPVRAFDVLVSLEALSIKGNAIRIIPDGIFDPLGNLRHLILSGNRIERFPGNSLENAEYLDSLDLSSNNLSSVPEDFASIFAPYIYLYNNPWHCDCDTVRNFADWIQAVDGNIYDSTGLPDSRSVVCSSPPGQKGTPIIEFSPERICHVVTTIGTTLQTPRGTERSHISTSTVNLFKTSPPLEICAPYTDLESKRGANCSHRSLVSIPHPLPPDTEILLLNYNNLSSVPLTSFQSLPHLKDLDLSHNQIQHFDPVSPLPLEKLDLSSNSLTRIPDFRNLRNLKKLVLDHNQIPDLPVRAFDVLVSLEALSIKGNAIRIIPDGIFDPLGNLRHLILSGNRIETFPGNSLENAEYLDSLDLSSNNLSSVPEDFASIFAPYIYLYNNPWHCDCDTVRNFADWIQAVDGNIYDSTGLPDSRSIVCSSPPGQKGTPIIEFSPERICHVVTTIGTTLQTPRGTERSHISTSTVNLFKTSPPPEICALYTDLESKRGANCSHRSLVSIPHPLPPDTEILLMNYNNLSSIPLTSFQSLPHLKDLDLSHNQIQHFDPVSPLPLEKLDLSSNSLTRIPDFRNLRNLKKLVLDHNQIPDLPAGAFDILVSLEALSIKGNAIRVIPDGIFDPLGNLRHLILSGNRIERFPRNSLQDISDLDILDISSNNLSSVPEDFASIFAPYIYLYNNPWHCDCNTVPNLREWIEYNNGNIYDSTGLSDSRSVVCSSPPGQKGIPIIKFSLEQICHVVTTIGTTLQTARGTERSHISTSTVNLFRTSPPPEICAPYTDLESKRGANCSHRSLVSIPQPLPPDTEILLLNYNNLSSVPLTSFQSLPHLKDLDLSHNQIQHFDPVSPLPLEKLDLSSNSLTRIPNFRNLWNLKKLVLDHNQIPDLPAGAFDDLMSLEELSIKGNAVQDIPDGIFEKLEELTHLILSGNRIKRLSNHSFHNLRNLTTLDISNNQIRTVPQEIFGINPALCLLLSGNPLHCSCDIQYLLKWTELMERAKSCGNKTFDDKGIICKTPISMEGRLLFQLSLSELCKSSTPGYGALMVHSYPQATSRSHPTSASPEDAAHRWERVFGLLEALDLWGLDCYLLFLLHGLALALVLLANCLLLLSVARFHHRCLVPMRELAERPFGIKLVRYSLLLPDPRQIYPAPSTDSEPGWGEEGSEKDDDLTLSGRGSLPPSFEGSY